MQRLVLFDIDGTLLSVHGAGSRSMLAAVESVFACTISPHGYSMSGKTDTQIVRELLERNGGTASQIHTLLPRVWDLHVQTLERVLPTVDITVYPGIRTLIECLSGHADVVLGLLTGNVERAAWLKVRQIGLDGYFRLGAFGDNSPERCLLPDLAVKQAKVLTGKLFQAKQIVIIGDTPNDILCGRHLGVKSIAVATGNYSSEELQPFDPDYLFENLADTGRVLESVLG